jgi:hypothetical protein
MISQMCSEFIASGSILRNQKRYAGSVSLSVRDPLTPVNDFAASKTASHITIDKICPELIAKGAFCPPKKVREKCFPESCVKDPLTLVGDFNPLKTASPSMINQICSKLIAWGCILLFQKLYAGSVPLSPARKNRDPPYSYRRFPLFRNSIA